MTHFEGGAVASGPMRLPSCEQQDTRFVQRKQKHALAQSKIIIYLVVFLAFRQFIPQTLARLFDYKNFWTKFSLFIEKKNFW